MGINDGQVVLEARDINKTFGGVKALLNVSISLTAGDVHCIVGENGCGKSTLIKIISGAETADSGELVISGQILDKVTPAWALRNGIQVIYQDFALFPNLTVLENMVITSSVAEKRKIISLKAMRPRAEEIIEELGLSLDLDALVESLSVADRQLTAICRSLVHDPKILFMDEPTTALTQTEIRHLFEIVERLRRRNVAVVFVSHKLDEVLQVSQYVTVMRNGRNVVSGPVANFDIESLIENMTGRKVSSDRQLTDPQLDKVPALEVRDLSLESAFKDVSFQVAPGEILGISGLLGSGRSEIAETIAGVYKPTSGSVIVGGTEVPSGSIAKATEAGIGYVPEDRLTQGLFLEKPISDNIIASSLDRYTGEHSPFLNRRKIERVVDEFFGKMHIKAPSAELPVRALSGGNAQRVVLAKALAASPKVLILNGPTVGVDVGSKEQILNLLREQAEQGIGVVVISDDVPELVSVCNRVLIVKAGRVAAELADDAVTFEALNMEIAA